MGSPKAMLDLRGETFFEEAGEAIKGSGAAARILVTSPKLAEVLDWERYFSELVLNEEPDRGQIYSLQLGLGRLLEVMPEALGALVLLVDNPGGQARRVAAVLEAVRKSPGRVLAAAHGGRSGHPLWLPRRLWEGVLAWDGPEGTRGFLSSAGEKPEGVEAGPLALCDIDTPEEYRRFLEGRGRE